MRDVLAARVYQQINFEGRPAKLGLCSGTGQHWHPWAAKHVTFRNKPAPVLATFAPVPRTQPRIVWFNTLHTRSGPILRPRAAERQGVIRSGLTAAQNYWPQRDDADILRSGSLPWEDVGVCAAAYGRTAARLSGTASFSLPIHLPKMRSLSDTGHCSGSILI